MPDGPFVLASPLSGWPAKQWPLEYYSRLARLCRDAGVPLVVNGPPSAHEALGGVENAILHLSSIAGLIDATRRATVVVGEDSGPLHLAAALGKPGVAIFGPTDPAQTGPYGGSLTVLRSPDAITSYKRRREIDASMRAVAPGRGVRRTRGAGGRTQPALPSVTMIRFPKPYADLVARLRVPFGFVLVAAFAWFSQPDARSLEYGLPLSLIGLWVRALGRRPPGEEPDAGDQRPLRLHAQSALSGNAAGGCRTGRRIAQHGTRGTLRGGVHWHLSARDPA